MISKKAPRLLYIIYRVVEMIIQVMSRFINAAFFGGSTYQTLSARSHVEYVSNPQSRKWRVIRGAINAIFFVQDDHCLDAWQAEIAHAEKTLLRAEVAP